MPIKYKILLCIRCGRQYAYWKAKGNSKSYCPDCGLTQCGVNAESRKHEVSGWMGDIIYDPFKKERKNDDNRDLIDRLIKKAGLTKKQVEAIKEFRETNKVPGNKSGFYLAIEKLKRAGF